VAEYASPCADIRQRLPDPHLLQRRCSAFTSWRARIRYSQTLALPAHDKVLVFGHVTFVLQQLFQISLERGLCFNHRIE
jgi:hypothetical protein